jgi:cobalamin synthase
LLAAISAAWLFSPQAALICALCSLGTALIFGVYCWNKLQGITGDCVGATNEIAEISVLVGGMVLGMG